MNYTADNGTSTLTMPVGNDSGIPDNNIFHRYDLSKLIEVFAPTAFTAERVVPPIWYIIGFLGNPASAVIWYGSRMRRNNSSAMYLGSLAVSDFIFLFLHLLHNLHVSYGHDVYNTFAGCEAFMFFFYVPQYLSVFLVAVFTIERYVAVCHPFLKEKWCTVKRAFILTGVCVILSMALSTGQIYAWTYDATYEMCTHRPEAMVGLEDMTSFVEVWNWVIDMTMFAALPLLVLVFNILVLREIIKLSSNGVIVRQQGRGGNHSSTRGSGASGTSSSTASTVTLLSVSFFLIVTQLAATVVSNIQQAFPHGPVNMTDDEVRADPTWSAMFTYIEARKVIEVSCYRCSILVVVVWVFFRRLVGYRGPFFVNGISNKA